VGIQLSLYPTRGFGLLMWGELLIDHRTGEPAIVSTPTKARRMLVRETPKYLRPQTEIVEVEIHEGDELPTYVIGDTVPVNNRGGRPVKGTLRK
jgi:hypothetical protein